MRLTVGESLMVVKGVGPAGVEDLVCDKDIHSTYEICCVCELFWIYRSSDV